MMTRGEPADEPARGILTERELQVGELMLRAAALETEEQRVFLEQTLQDPELVLEVRKRLEAVAAEVPTDFLGAPTGLAGAALGLGGDTSEAVPLEPEQRYEIGDLLGVGGMARVYRANDLQLDRVVALKLLASEASGQQAALREARAQARVHHPGVIAVYETGERHGQSYIAMQHVDGKTLGEVADAMALEALVQLLADVAEALHAAHRRGLVHRDIKPANILVQAEPDGEMTAFVGDFGIAQLEKAEDANGLMPSRFAGTPAFMAPEQLRGDSLDRRVDVYGLGVTLYRLLTGRMPFSAPSTDQLLDKILHGEPVPILELVPSLPKELEAVTRRAMARSPADRYPSARALAEDLRRYLDGDVVEAYASTLAYRMTRHALKHRTLWSVSAAAAVVVLISLGISTVFTRQAKNVADLRRGQAEELLTFMVVDLRSKLAPVNRLEVLEDVGERALAYFASVPADELREEELVRRSQALYQIGDVRMRQGDLESAADAFGASLELAEDLHGRAPDRLDWLFELGQARFWVGYVHFERGESEIALNLFESYLETGMRLLATEPGNLDYLMEVAYGHDNVGRAHESLGATELALSHFSQHGEILRRLVREQPERLEPRAELAGNRILVGRMLAVQRRYDQALEALADGEELLRELTAKKPERRVWRERLATCHHYLGEVFEAFADFEQAQEHHDRQLEMVRALMAEDPDNARWRFYTAVASKAAARMARLRGDWHRQRQEIVAAESLLEGLLAMDSSKTSWRFQRALVEVEKAEDLRHRGRLTEALTLATSAQSSLNEELVILSNPGAQDAVAGANDLVRGLRLALDSPPLQKTFNN